jgi:hypothetical protein
MKEYTSTANGSSSVDFDIDVLKEAMDKFKPIENPIYVINPGQLEFLKCSAPTIKTGDNDPFPVSSFNFRVMSSMDFGITNPYPHMPVIHSVFGSEPEVNHKEPIPYGSPIGVWVTLFVIAAAVAFMVSI